MNKSRCLPSSECWTLLFILLLTQVKVSSQELETVNNRTERYNYRHQEQYRQRQVPFSMSDKYSDILTTDYAKINSRKVQRHPTKRNSEGVEKNETKDTDPVFKEVIAGGQTRITAAPFSPAFAQNTLFSPSLKTLEDRDLLMMQDSPDIQSDDPFIKFRYEQFNFGKTESTTASIDQHARMRQKLEIIRKRQRKTLFRKSQKQMSEEYERHKYIQIHNKFESVRLEAVKSGRVVPMNREISKMSIFAQHYSPTHNGVYIQNVGYCGYLCVNKTGRVYINDRLGDDCLFSTSTQQHDITDSVKFVSLAHSNASHSLYVALGPSPASVEGLQVPGPEVPRHRRDWILLPVSFKQLKQVFRKKDLPLVANRWGLQEIYCPKLVNRRRQRRQNAGRKGSNNCKRLEGKGKKKCEEKLCLEKRPRKYGKVELCTKKEKKSWREFNGRWRWKTRDCSSLSSRRDVKKCKKDKRQRKCVDNKMKRKKASDKMSAWLSCVKK